MIGIRTGFTKVAECVDMPIIHITEASSWEFHRVVCSILPFFQSSVELVWYVRLDQMLIIYDSPLLRPGKPSRLELHATPPHRGNDDLWSCRQIVWQMTSFLPWRTFHVSPGLFSRYDKDACALVWNWAGWSERVLAGVYFGAYTYICSPWIRVDVIP